MLRVIHIYIFQLHTYIAHICMCILVVFPLNHIRLMSIFQLIVDEVKIKTKLNIFSKFTKKIFKPNQELNNKCYFQTIHNSRKNLKNFFIQIFISVYTSSKVINFTKVFAAGVYSIRLGFFKDQFHLPLPQSFLASFIKMI